MSAPAALHSSATGDLDRSSRWRGVWSERGSRASHALSELSRPRGASRQTSRPLLSEAEHATTKCGYFSRAAWPIPWPPERFREPGRWTRPDKLSMWRTCAGDGDKADCTATPSSMYRRAVATERQRPRTAVRSRLPNSRKCAVAPPRRREYGCQLAGGRRATSTSLAKSRRKTCPPFG